MGEVASNASRWGRLCLACTSVAMKVYGLRPWRPLRHTACATSPALAGEALGYNGIIASPVATGEVASMRADGGACALRSLLSLWKVYSLRSWHPLRHTACATSPASAGEARGTLRPLAGFWFLNGIAEEYVKKNTGTFPSPCGVPLS